MTTRWQEGTGGGSGRDYAASFAALAADGVDVHGEATLCETLLSPPGRVLDAGCGTGRVAVRLAGRGYDVAGVDLDDSMLEVARAAAPGLTWLRADLAGDLASELGTFDLVVAAGNVLPLCAPGTEARVVVSLAATLRPAGGLVMGFGLDADHLPGAAAHLALDDVDAWCAAAGLTLSDRWATWDREPYAGGGYAVSAYRRSSGSAVAASPPAPARRPDR